MPFTLAHPAVVVPLARRGLILSALVVGSMAPDFEYFLRLSHDSLVSHTFPGIFTFCVPVGIVVLWLFHEVLKTPLMALLPLAHQERFDPARFSFTPTRRFFFILVSLAVGALTHILWDSFTHENALTQNVPFFSYPVLETKQGTLRIYKIFQHGSTVVGLLLLGYWHVRWFLKAPRRRSLSPIFTARQKVLVVLVLLLIAGIAGVVNGLRHESLDSFLSFRHFVGTAVITAIPAMFVGVFLFSIGWHLKYRRYER